MYLSELRLENFRRFKNATIMLQPGLNVLVGENDSGKSTILDAIRLVLGTTSQDFFRIEDDDFHVAANSAPAEALRISLRFDDITVDDGGTFIEHLTYENGAARLYVSLTAKRLQNPTVRRRFDVDARTGTIRLPQFANAHAVDVTTGDTE